MCSVTVPSDKYGRHKWYNKCCSYRERIICNEAAPVTGAMSIILRVATKTANCNFMKFDIGGFATIFDIFWLKSDNSNEHFT
jgi:hypothetical protein